MADRWQHFTAAISCPHSELWFDGVPNNEHPKLILIHEGPSLRKNLMRKRMEMRIRRLELEQCG